MERRADVIQALGMRMAPTMQSRDPEADDELESGHHDLAVGLIEECRCDTAPGMWRRVESIRHSCSRYR